MKAQFWQLFKKEIREISTLSVAYGVLSIGWMIFLLAMRGWWYQELIFGLSFIPLCLLPFYAIAQGFTSFRSEWKSDTIYTVLALPLPGWYFTASKLLACMAAFTVLSLIHIGIVFVVGSSFIEIFFDLISENVSSWWIWKTCIGLYLFFWFGSGVIYIVSQFSYLVSRLVNRFNGLFAGIVFLFSHWFLFRVGGWVAVLLNWLPKYKIQAWEYASEVSKISIIQIPIAPWIGVLILGIGLGYLGSWILENILEV